MKKTKKRFSSTRRSSSQSNNAIDQPPESLINEMMAAFNAGELVSCEQKAREAVKHWPDHPFGWKALANLFIMQGKMENALEPLAKSVHLSPDDAQALNNLGSVFLELKRLEEAEVHVRKALALQPDYFQAHNNLGIIYMELRRFEDAVASYQQSLMLKPDFAEAHNNLGNCLKELGRLEDAEKSYRLALLHNKTFAEAYNNLGTILMALGRVEDAAESYRQALTINPDYVQAQNGLGDIFLKRGQLHDAAASYRACIELDPTRLKAHDGLNRALGALVPMWHVPMMNDKFRNDAYFAALQNAVTPATHVLEIGTGSGLLAMMSARLGARKVTTCEAVTDIAETAKDIVAANGFSPPVTVVPKMSTKMIVGKDIEDRADLLVSEILSSEFLGEGVLSSIEDAKRRLLKPGARIIPARGSIQFALFGGADIEKNLCVNEVYGFDLNKFNSLVPRKQYISRNDLNIELLTDDTSAFFFDFAGTDRFPAENQKIIEVPVSKGGRCCGIIQWIRLEMDDTTVFENHPLVKNTASGWQHCAYVFPTPLDVLPGQVAVISAIHNRNTPWFFFKELK